MMRKLIKMGFNKNNITVSFLLGGSDLSDEILTKIEIITQEFCISTGRVPLICRRPDM